VLVVNKVDMPEVRARVAEIGDAFRDRGEEPLFISGATGEGVEALLERVAALLEAAEAEEEGEGAPAGAEEEPPVRQVLPAVRIVREDGAFRVEGERVVAFAEVMPVEQEEARAELWRRLGRWGVVAALRRAGAKPGDRVRLGRVELEVQG
jgi:GTP-binding protein